MKPFALTLVALSACVFTGPRSKYVPHGPAAAAALAPRTAGDALLKYLPDGADLIVEIDLARLYANPTVGEPVRRALAAPGDELEVPGLILPHGADPLAQASVIVLAAYAVGTADATTATIVATKGEVPGGVAIADGVIALAPPPMLARVQDVASGAAPSIARDAVMMQLRARAMPAGAPGATLRATARLGLDARVALAPVLGPDLAPASLSVWADVVDDAALVALLDGHDAAGGGGARLLVALERTRVALAGSTTLLRLGLAPTVREATFTRAGDLVRVVATIGPKRLSALAQALYPPGP